MAEKEIVELNGRRYECHPHGWGGYRVYHRIEYGPNRHTLRRVRHPGLQTAVIEELQEKRSREERRRWQIRELAERNGDPDPDPDRREDGTNRLRRAAGYPWRWLKAFLRAGKIETDAGPWTWARKATLWARTDP